MASVSESFTPLPCARCAIWRALAGGRGVSIHLSPRWRSGPAPRQRIGDRSGETLASTSPWNASHSAHGSPDADPRSLCRGGLFVARRASDRSPATRFCARSTRAAMAASSLRAVSTRRAAGAAGDGAFDGRTGRAGAAAPLICTDRAPSTAAQRAGVCSPCHVRSASTAASAARSKASAAVRASSAARSTALRARRCDGLGAFKILLRPEAFGLAGGGPVGGVFDGHGHVRLCFRCGCETCAHVVPFRRRKFCLARSRAAAASVVDHLAQSCCDDQLRAARRAAAGPKPPHRGHGRARHLRRPARLELQHQRERVARRRVLIHLERAMARFSMVRSDVVTRTGVPAATSPARIASHARRRSIGPDHGASPSRRRPGL